MFWAETAERWRGRAIDLLKIDIDSFEGLLLSQAVALLKANATSIGTLIEYR